MGKKKLSLNKIIVISGVVIFIATVLYAGSGFVFSLNKSLKKSAGNQAYIANIQSLIQDENTIVTPNNFSSQSASIKLLSGKEKGSIVTGSYNYFKYGTFEHQDIHEGDLVIVLPFETDEKTIYNITQKFRLHYFGLVVLLFLALVIVYLKKRGLRAIIALLFSISAIIFVLIPLLLIGKNAVLVCGIGAIIIVIISMYVSHGFNLNTTAALVSSSITIIIAVVASQLVIMLNKLSGAGSDEVFQQLVYIYGHELNLRGLLLGAIIIGTLGLIDDIAITQVNVVDQIKKANPLITDKNLITNSLKVGKEHIISMINTLALVYLSASLPILLLYYINTNFISWWVLFNEEWFVEEILSTLLGSGALILMVPISTFVVVYLKYSEKLNRVSAVSWLRKQG